MNAEYDLKMKNVNKRRGWRQFMWRRKEVVRTTWRFRAVLGFGLAVITILAHSKVLTALGRSLVYSGPVAASDAIVLENYDPNYLVFEKARQLMERGLAPRVIIPCDTFGGPDPLNDVAEGFIEVMIRVSRLQGTEVVPVTAEEPYTLNTARAMSKYLEDQDIRSVIVVSPPFRSRRSYLVYESVLEPLGIELYCVPARGSRTPEDWWKSTHGIQDVALEFGKLWYYRLIVL